MGEPIDGQRKLKQGYAKKGFQTPYAQVGESVDPNPPPPSSYSTTTHVATSPVQPGLVPRTAQRDVVALGNIASFRNYNNEVYPWHLVPKGNSSNIIKRERESTITIAAGASFDLIDLFVSDSGANTQASSSGTAVGPTPANLTNEFWAIKKFGHAELNGITSGITYQIIVDNEIELSWSDFQLSPSAPYNQLWEFENPFSVNERLQFRIINGTLNPYNTSVAGNAIDATFVGWTEQYVYGADDRFNNVESI
tara:strand:- start:21606 stop:22361 length:756 start_codon:yes stop_codon:yes gene_type:complete